MWHLQTNENKDVVLSFKVWIAKLAVHHLFGEDVFVLLDVFVPHRLQNRSERCHTNTGANQHHNFILKDIFTGRPERPIHSHPTQGTPDRHYAWQTRRLNILCRTFHRNNWALHCLLIMSNYLHSSSSVLTLGNTTATKIHSCWNRRIAYHLLKQKTGFPTLLFFATVIVRPHPLLTHVFSHFTSETHYYLKHCICAIQVPQEKCDIKKIVHPKTIIYTFIFTSNPVWLSFFCRWSHFEKISYQYNES